MNAQRKVVKAGKHERIRAYLRNMLAMGSESQVKDQQRLSEMGEAIGLPGYRTSQERQGNGLRRW